MSSIHRRQRRKSMIWSKCVRITEIHIPNVTFGSHVLRTHKSKADETFVVAFYQTFREFPKSQGSWWTVEWNGWCSSWVKQQGWGCSVSGHSELQKNQDSIKLQYVRRSIDLLQWKIWKINEKFPKLTTFHDKWSYNSKPDFKEKVILGLRKLPCLSIY